jgi:beta-lactamase class A
MSKHLGRISSLVVCALLAGGLAACSVSATPASSASSSSASDTQRALAALEKSHHSRLGVAVVDPRTGRIVSYRAHERFAFASTNKTFIAAAVLDNSTPADLATVVHYSRSDLLAYAPITSQFVEKGMTVTQLLDAMLRFSDNTAANILVGRLGGPSEVQQYLRRIGDMTTHVDRLEPDLNQAIPGDVRDTTTPTQFAKDLRSVILGSQLDSPQQVILRNDMLDNTTGDGTIRSGVNAAWPVADKTGTGDRGVRNDIAVVYPTGHSPIVVVIMTAPNDPTSAADDSLVAAATKIAVSAIFPSGS